MSDIDSSKTSSNKSNGRATIWDFPSPEKPLIQKTDEIPITVKKVQDSNYSFIPKTETKPGASKAQVINIETSRQSRSRTRNNANVEQKKESKSKTSAFQNLWPQTYNSFQNRAVS